MKIVMMNSNQVTFLQCYMHLAKLMNRSEKRVVLVRVSLALMKHYDQKASQEGNGLLFLYFHITANH